MSAVTKAAQAIDDLKFELNASASQAERKALAKLLEDYEELKENGALAIGVDTVLADLRALIMLTDRKPRRGGKR